MKTGKKITRTVEKTFTVALHRFNVTLKKEDVEEEEKVVQQLRQYMRTYRGDPNVIFEVKAQERQPAW